jgi:Arm DNA-binding domain
MLGQGAAMARNINRLSARAVATITAPGRHADGGNLYLSISENGGRRWTFLYRWHGKLTELGFGSARDVPLAKARQLATEARSQIAAGVNPKHARRPDQVPTFGECANQVFESMKPEWKHNAHTEQWEHSMKVHAAMLRDLQVDKIGTEEVLATLKPLWLTKPVTAGRVRQRIERVLGWARVKGFRSGENPARWKEHLAELLPNPSKLHKVEHFDVCLTGMLRASWRGSGNGTV